jgi:phosphatidylserine/phosphatidylglycerophosphate/cardiolipin synthase-like enzyme
MIHAKVLLVDNKYAVVGSQNIDPRSFEHNIESSLAFKNTDMIKDLGEIITKWKLVSVPFLYPKNKYRWYHPLLEKLFEFIRPIL